MKFRVKSILILCVAIATCLLAGIWIHRTYRQLALVKWVEKHNGYIYYDFQYDSESRTSNYELYPDNLPSWLFDSFGYDWYCNIATISLNPKQPLSLEELDYQIAQDLRFFSIRYEAEDESDYRLEGQHVIGLFRNLEVLDLPDCKNLSCDFLKQLRSLQWLQINTCNQNEADLIGELPKIGMLRIADCQQITDYQFLSKLKNLEDLDLYNCQKFDLKHLKDLKKLKYLVMYGTGSLLTSGSLPNSIESLYIGDWGTSDLRFVESATNLKKLHLEGGNITNWPTAEKIPNLQEVSLQSIAVKDLTDLGSHSKLKTLTLYECQVSQEDSITKLKTLRNLSVNSSNNWDLTTLSKLKFLKTLELDYGYDLDLNNLLLFNHLERINCYISKSSRPTLLKVVKQKPELLVIQ